MAIFPSLPDQPELSEVFRAFPGGLEPLLEYHDAILRGESPLSVAERELIAAYVSGVNQCNFCHGAHRTYAEVHGIDPDIFEQLIADPQSAGVDDKLLPIFAYVRKLTLTPSQIGEADAAPVYKAGWSEQALFDAISVCALFNLMNRIVDGSGVAANPLMRVQSRARAESARDNRHPYRDFAKVVLRSE